MAKTSWTERKTNKETEEQRSFMSISEKRKTNIFGHIIKHNNSLTNLLKGKFSVRKIDESGCDADCGLSML